MTDYRIVLERSFVNCDLVTRDYGDDQLHVIKTTGPIGTEHRLPLYEAAIKDNNSGNFFYVLDNRGGFEIRISAEDIILLNEFLFERGIRQVRAAVVTNEEAYKIMISLVHAQAQATNFDVEMISTPSFDDAEDFVLSKLMEKQGK